MDWRFSLFLLALFGLLAAFSLAPWDSTLCNSCFVKDVLANHTKDGALNCFEFWFSRYQTLIGVLATLGAAWYAGFMVAKQLRRTDAQIAQVQTQIPLLRAQASAVRAVELRNMIEASDAISKLQDKLQATLTDHRSMCAVAIFALRQMIDTDPDSPYQQPKLTEGEIVNRLEGLWSLMHEESQVLNEISNACALIIHPTMYSFYDQDNNVLTYDAFQRKLRRLERECKSIAEEAWSIRQKSPEMRRTSLYPKNLHSRLMAIQSGDEYFTIHVLLSSYDRQRNELSANLLEALEDMVLRVK